eukprot:Rmarinus@m.26717
MTFGILPLREINGLPDKMACTLSWYLLFLRQKLPEKSAIEFHVCIALLTFLLLLVCFFGSKWWCWPTYHMLACSCLRCLFVCLFVFVFFVSVWYQPLCANKHFSLR